MKKKIIVAASCIIMLFSMTACGDTFDKVDVDQINMQILSTINNNSNEVLVYTDPQTHVEYLVVDGYEEMAITPRYNADGTIRTSQRR